MLNFSDTIASVLHQGPLARKDGGRLVLQGPHGLVLSWSGSEYPPEFWVPDEPLSYVGRELPIHRAHSDLRMLDVCIQLFEQAVLTLATCENSGLCSLNALDKILANLSPIVLSSLDRKGLPFVRGNLITKKTVADALKFCEGLEAGVVRLGETQLVNVLGEDRIGEIHPTIVKLMGEREFVESYSGLLGKSRFIHRPLVKAPRHGWILSEVFKQSSISDDRSIPLLLTSCLALGAMGRAAIDVYLDQDMEEFVSKADPDEPSTDPAVNSLMVLDYMAGLVLSAKAPRAINTLSLPYAPRGKRVVQSQNGVAVNFEYDLIVRQMEVSLFRPTSADEALSVSRRLRDGVQSTLSIRESEFTTLVGGSGVGKSTRVAEIIEALVDCRERVEKETGRRMNIFFADTSEPSPVMVEDSSNDPVIPVTDSPLARVWATVRAGDVIPLHGLKPFGADLTEMLSTLESSGVVKRGDLNILILDSASDLVDEAQMVNPELRSGSRTGGRDSAIRKVFQQQTNALSQGGWAVVQTVNLQSMPGHKDQANDFAFTYSISGGSDVTALLLGDNEVPFIRDRSAGAMFVDNTSLGVLSDPNATNRFPGATEGTITKQVLNAIK